MSRTGLALLAVVVATLAPAAAGKYGVEATEAGVPLSIHATYNAVPTPDVACGGMHVIGTGTATGTPVGPSLWADEECANLLVMPGKITITGILVITTTSGEELRASYRATADLPDPDGTIRPAGTFQIVGGTGRFSNATGGGSITATANVFHPATVADMEGVISMALNRRNFLKLATRAPGSPGSTP